MTRYGGDHCDHGAAYNCADEAREIERQELWFDGRSERRQRRTIIRQEADYRVRPRRAWRIRATLMVLRAEDGFRDFTRGTRYLAEDWAKRGLARLRAWVSDLSGERE